MHYLADNAVLQSNQLRQLVQDSLNSYVAFFEQYRPAAKPAVAKADGEQVQSHAPCNKQTCCFAFVPCPLDSYFGLYSLLTSDCRQCPCMSQVALCRQLSSGQSFILPACPAQSSVHADSTISTDPLLNPQVPCCPMLQVDLHYICTRFALECPST